MLDNDLFIQKQPTINFAIGPNCPVRCEGCYNHFGETFYRGGLVTASEVIDFASATTNEGITQATLSGGDPLFHPEIIPILSGLKDLGLKIKLDTVGTAFLSDTAIAYKGSGTAGKVNILEVVPHVDFVNIPLDGASQEVISNFRRGRSDLFEETKIIAELLRKSGVAFGFNTVANATNLSELAAIRDIAENLGATEWQIFEYDSNGPNPTSKKSILKLGEGHFEEAIKDLATGKGSLRIVSKSLNMRSNTYFLIDDSGLAWKPAGEGLRQIMGHITTDKEQVLAALRIHIQNL